MSRNWGKVNIPEGIHETIKTLIETYPELGYHSVSAFVTDAVRRRIEAIQQQKKDTQEKVPIGDPES
jgi:hypothetical protein